MNRFNIFPGDSAGLLIVDGKEVPNIMVNDETEHTLVVKGVPFVFKAASADEDALTRWQPPAANP